MERKELPFPGVRDTNPSTSLKPSSRSGKKKKEGEKKKEGLTMKRTGEELN